MKKGSTMKDQTKTTKFTSPKNKGHEKKKKKKRPLNLNL